MAQDTIITGLDIGSTAIRAAVGQLTQEGDRQRLHILGVAFEPSEGVYRGEITNVEDAVKSMTRVLEQLERKTGVPIETAWVGMTGSNILTKESKGVVAVGKVDGEIREEDVERALEAARTVTVPPNYELLHVLPRGYVIDGQPPVQDPVGMSGIRLEVDTYIISGQSTQIKNLTKAVYQTGLDIEDVVLSVLATAEAVVTARQKELGVAVVNIGASTTTLAVFEGGIPLHVATLPIGSERITSDIAIGLRTSLDIADQIKLRYGVATAKGMEKKEEFDMAEFDEYEDGGVSKKYVAEIIEARVEELFEKIDAELKDIDRSGILPAGAVITGGGAKLPKIVDVGKRVLRLPAALGYPLDITSVMDEVQDLSYAPVIGLVKWGSAMLRSRPGTSRFSSVGTVTKSIQKWFKALIP